MTEAEMVETLRLRISNGQDLAPTATDFEQAQNYCYGRLRGDEMEGRSVVQSLDVQDMVEALQAQILPTFSQDTVCRFEPDGPNDEIQARLESDVTNKVMMESSRGYVVLYEAVQDALRFKNGIVKVYLVEDEGSYRKRTIRMTAVDPANFIVGQGTDCILLYDVDFCAERKQYTRAELLDMGFDRDKISEIPIGDADVQGPPYSSKRKAGMQPMQENIGWANEWVIIWECYGQFDWDDSGSTKLYRCLVGGQTLLLKEAADTIPYAAGTGFIEAHAFWGLSVFDRLRSVQDVKTGIQRQWLDNLANCNNSRTVVNENVNLDDLKTGRPGGITRIKGMGPVMDSLMPLPVIDAGAAAQGFLAYMDQVRSDRAGASMEMASGEMQEIGSQIGSQGVDRIFSVQELKAGMIARTLAETLLRSAFMLVHKLLRTELKEKLTVRMADQWIEVDPVSWRPRDRVNIKSGLSPGERSRKASALSQVLSMQAQALQGGMDGVLVSLPNIYSAFLDWCSANEIDAGERYFTDPASQLSQQAGQAKAQQGQQQQQMQMQMAHAQMQIEQSKVQVQQIQAQMEAQAKDAELRFKYYDARLSAEVEEAKIVGTATADLQRVELEGQYAAQQAASSRNGSAGESGA